MIKPHQVDNLPTLDANQKQTFRNGLAGLWHTFESSPEGSPQKQEAKMKIVGASQKIMQQISAKNRPNSGGQPQQQPPQQMQQQQRPQQNSQNVNQQPQQQPQQPSHNALAANQGQQQGGQQSQPSQQSQAQVDIDNNLKKTVSNMINSLQVYPEPGITNNQQFDTYKQNFKSQLGSILLKQERSKNTMIQIKTHINNQVKQNKPIDELKHKFHQYQTMVTQCQQQSKVMLEANERNKGSQRKQQDLQQYASQQQQRSTQPQTPAGGQQVSGNQAQISQRPSTQQGPGNGAQDVRMNQTSASPARATAQGGFQQPNPQQAQLQAQSQGTHAQPTPKPMPSQSQPASTTPQQTPQSATQPQAPQQQPGNIPPQGNIPQQGNAPQQVNIPQQQPQRPQTGAQQVPPQGQYSQQHPNPPNPAIPQGANSASQPQQPQRPQALSQQGAIARAQEQNFQQQSSANQQQGLQQPSQNIANGIPFNQQPPNQHTPTSTFPQSQQLSSVTNKFPIPKQLNLGPQAQTAVSGPPSRPTMMGQGGMMGMPGVQKAPPFTLEGEGDHVLSKRKLDELVRQITGSTNPADGLTPEVEEAVLSMTDNFVDNVITKACQLAKLRQGQSLDIRDVQMVLERNYGIRIPGYSLDEVRTVRKFQPAPGWVGKVQAVQAGKVMGGNRDA